MSENIEISIKPKMTSSVIEERRNQKILTFKRLETEFLLFALKNVLKPIGQLSK